MLQVVAQKHTFCKFDHFVPRCMLTMSLEQTWSDAMSACKAVSSASARTPVASSTSIKSPSGSFHSLVLPLLLLFAPLHAFPAARQALDQVSESSYCLHLSAFGQRPDPPVVSAIRLLLLLFGPSPPALGACLGHPLLLSRSFANAAECCLALLSCALQLRMYISYLVAVSSFLLSMHM